MEYSDLHDDLNEVLLTKEQISKRIAEVARQVEQEYHDKDVLLVAVLKGAVMVLADFARELHIPVEMDMMALSSYGSGTQSSGVVRVVKDLDTDVRGRHVLIVEDIIDSGITLSWLVRNLKARGVASLEIFTLLRKPDAVRVELDVKYVGFDIPSDFVVGYGLDFNEKYRNLQCVGVLKPEMYN